MVSNPAIGTTNVFVDASVLFAASRSPRGSARDLIEVGIRGQITLVLSPFVIQETRRNLLSKAPEVLSLFDAFLVPRFRAHGAAIAGAGGGGCHRHRPQGRSRHRAGAIHAGASLAATYDRKHLLSKRAEIFAAFGVTVATPGEILAGL